MTRFQAVSIVMSTEYFQLHVQEHAVSSLLANPSQTSKPPGRFRVPFFSCRRKKNKGTQIC